MNITDLYLKLFLAVVLPLIGGMLFSKKEWAARWSSRLFALALYLFNTLIAFLAVWTAQLVNNAWILPFIVLIGWLLSMGIAYAAQSLMKHESKQRGAFLFSICLSNHGYTLLGIIALVVFGEAGLAQATYAQLLIVPFLILFCFPIARHFSDESTAGGLGQLLNDNIVDKRNLPLLAMLAGLTLNMTGVERPAIFSSILPPTVYLGTVVSGFAVGLLFNASKIWKFRKENLFSLIYRSTFYPLFYIGAARWLNLSPLDTVILALFGIVPSAIFSNLIADLFKLDKDLANSIYIVSTTIFLVIILPIYLLIVGTVALS